MNQNALEEGTPRHLSTNLLSQKSVNGEGKRVGELSFLCGQDIIASIHVYERLLRVRLFVTSAVMPLKIALLINAFGFIWQIGRLHQLKNSSLILEMI